MQALDVLLPRQKQQHTPELLFTVGRDLQQIPQTDALLFPYDILTNLAHTQMLSEVGILTTAEKNAIHQGLHQLFTDYQKGQWEFDIQYEDVHWNIEHQLTNHYNINAAEKMHIARSRNDQVATDMRLFLRHEHCHMLQSWLKTLDVLIDLGMQEVNTYMPGFTHYQPAMYSTFGHTISSWVAALVRHLERIFANLQLYNQCPLGAVAGFGSSWPIDRQRVAGLLGFFQPIENSLDAVTSRLEMETSIASDLNLLMLTLSTIAQDFILYSHPYYGFLRFSDKMTTHSSIMPQKKNADFAELIRAKTALLQGKLMSLLSLGKALPSGYNRDMQASKYLSVDLVLEAKELPSIFYQAFQDLTVDRQQCLQRCLVGGMSGVDLIDWLIHKAKMNFRPAYNLVQEVAYLYPTNMQDWPMYIEKKLLHSGIDQKFSAAEIKQILDPAHSVGQRQSFGSPNPVYVTSLLNKQREQVKDLQQSITVFFDSVEHKLNSLASVFAPNNQVTHNAACK